MIEERNRSERERRESLPQEYAEFLRPLPDRPNLPNVSSVEAAKLPLRKQCYSRDNILTQTRGKNLAGPYLAPLWKKCRISSTLYSSMLCTTNSSLAWDVIKGLRLATKKTKMKNQVQEINEPEFESQVRLSTEPVLVGFLAGWSKPSRLIEPVLDEVAEACNGNAQIFRVDVDDNPDLGTIYSIQSVPTLIYFLKGAVRAKIVGMASSKAILAKLNSLTPENPPTKDTGRPQ